MNDVTISGSASLVSLSLSGTLAVTGATTLSSTLAVTGTSTFTGVLTANNSIVGKNGLELYHATPFIDFHFGNSSADYTSRIIESDSGTLTIPKNLTVSTLLTATTGAITTLNSTTSTIHTLDVTDTFWAHDFEFEIQHVVDGIMRIAPTLRFPARFNGETSTTTAMSCSKSGSTLTITITDSSITTSTMAGIVWSSGSRVKVSGKIKGVATETMSGTISNIANGSLSVQVTGGNVANISATSTLSDFDDITVMVYERKDGSNYFPAGILINCYDSANSSATIRMYSGTSALPNVMLGNLTNAGLGTINGITPSGYGLFSQNVFLWGSIVSTEGQIGGWTIGDTKLYNNTDSMTSTSAGIYLGTNGIRNYKDANTFVNITGGVITAKAVDLTGKITASSGTIGGITLDNNYGLYTNSKTAANSSKDGFLISKNGAIYLGAYNTTNGTCPFQVTSDGKLTAISGKIGGWTISRFGLSYAGATPDSTSVVLIPGGTNSSNSIGGSSGSKTWIFTAKNVFGIDDAGKMFCNGGQIGGWTLDSNSLKTGTWGTENGVILCTGTSTAKSIGGSANTVSGWTFTSGEKFGVTKQGVVYGSDVHLTGEITANTGYIGGTSGWTITSGKIYSGTVDSGVTNGSVTLSTTDFSRTINNASRTGLRFAIGSKFGVSNAGDIYASSANLYGGTIGGFTLENGYLTYGSGDTTLCIAPEGAYFNGSTVFYNEPTGSDAVISESTVESDYLSTSSQYKMIVGSDFRIGMNGQLYSKSGVIGGWELSSDKFAGNSYSIMQNETGTVKNTTYLYSGTTSSEDITKQDSSNTYIIKPGTNASICVDFSTRPVHENRLGYYSDNLYINIGVKITGFVGNATIKYTYEYRDYDNKTISVTTAKHVNITETTTVYQPISIVPYGEVLLNADVQVVYETPYTINGSGGNISTLCSIRSSENTSTIFFYAKPINAYYLDSFSAMSIQRIYNNDTSTQEETYRLEQSGYIYSKGGLRTSGDIVFNDNISMIELSKRNAVQSATKSVAITSSNTIDGTPAIGAQLTLSPGTYLITGRFVFATASSSGSRNNGIAIYTGASPTNSTIINHSMVRVMTAAQNWGSLTTTCIVSPTATTTYTVGGVSSRPHTDAGESAIYAVRLL